MWSERERERDWERESNRKERESAPCKKKKFKSNGQTNALQLSAGNFDKLFKYLYRHIEK